MTNILPRERGEEILAAHASGMPIREIARAYGHSPGTVRDYAHGRRVPGEPAPRTDDLAPFAGYCRQRLADDPHLRTPGLLAELRTLGLDGSRATVYRGLERRGLRPHPCPDCYVARISGFAPLSAASRPPLFPLPVPAAPVAGETLTSFLSRLAEANRTSTHTLLGVLPPWFRVKTRWHDDRWQHPKLDPWTGDAAAALAVISGSSTTGITNALPAFGGNRGQPVRAVTACRLCTAGCRSREPVPVHLPAHHQVCLRHGIWLSAPGTPQLSVSGCPDILNAERLARRLARDHGIEHLIYARTRAPDGRDAASWKRRTAALIESNPRQVAESSPQALFQAAAYPDAIIAASASGKQPAGTLPGRCLPGCHHRGIRQPQKPLTSNLR